MTDRMTASASLCAEHSHMVYTTCIQCQLEEKYATPLNPGDRLANAVRELATPKEVAIGLEETQEDLEDMSNGTDLRLSGVEDELDEVHTALKKILSKMEALEGAVDAIAGES